MPNNSSLDLWGGHECTVNRVGDRYTDQTVLSGHETRLADLDLFWELGVKALRYPLLWERIAPDHPDERDWRWTDERLSRLQALNITPIAGLIHHGSGPRYTHLLDSGFSSGVAAHARAAAERYPWIEDWTPVNEPLTTARFSALYGHWYPHVRDEAAFWLALLNQIDAVRLSMREVRRVNPAARLIQTEDLGKTYSTRAMAHQASHDNQRRWMTWDLLCGKVDRSHSLFERLARFGLGDRLLAIVDNPCPPDIVGVNHYLTSDRFLDHRCERYPADRCGANEFMSYADVEAVRVTLPGPGGLEERLDEAWTRYGLPLAVTEAHAGCTREDQVRWLSEAWETAGRLKGRGVDMRAVTAWSLLGAYDWDSLLTSNRGRYEPGAFDLSGGAPRPTAVAHLIKSLAAKTTLPVAAGGSGWWRRDVRLQFQPVFRTVDAPEPRPAWRHDTAQAAPILITGATGTLGRALARACEWRGLDYVLADRAALDLSNPDSIARALDRHQPWAVINAAGWVRVDEAEAREAECHDANATGCARLAQACAANGVRFAGFSSDLVFDGRKGCAYVESDAPAPLNAYGRSKHAAEDAVLAAGGLMARTAAFFSPYDIHNFATHVARGLARGRNITAAHDSVVSPTYVPDLVDAVLDLVIDGEAGLWHLANRGAVSWAEFAGHLARALRLDTSLILPVAGADLGWAAPRPRHAPLASERGALLPPLHDAIGRYAAMMIASEFEAEVQAPLGQPIMA
jgi:dTDP-4-dehydrorhamnose reductase